MLEHAGESVLTNYTTIHGILRYFKGHYRHYRRSVVLVARSNLRRSEGGLRPGLCRYFISLDKKPCCRLSFSTQVYKWVPGK